MSQLVYITRQLFNKTRVNQTRYLSHSYAKRIRLTINQNPEAELLLNRFMHFKARSATLSPGSASSGPASVRCLSTARPQQRTLDSVRLHARDAINWTARGFETCAGESCASQVRAEALRVIYRIPLRGHSQFITLTPPPPGIGTASG